MDEIAGWLNEVTSSGVFQTLGLVALALLVLLFFLGQIKPGEAKPIPPEQKPWMRGLGIAGWVLIPLFAILFIASLIQIAVMWTDLPDNTEPLALRVHYLAIVGFIGVLGGILAALAAYIRIFTIERQTTAQEQGLITDRINKAVENLGATRTVQRQRRRKTGALAYAPDEAGEPDYSQPIFEEVTEPNLEVRIGGIYALERIARDNLDYHVQIMEILTAYVRENAKATDAEDFPEPDWKPLPDDATDEERRAREAARAERFGRFFFESKAFQWARKLCTGTDIQAALTVIGRRSARQIEQEKADTRQRKEGYRPDLRGTSLQGADLSNLDFSGVNFVGVRMEGADLREARIERANLHAAHLQGAGLHEARLEGAFLSNTWLEGADLSIARIERAELIGARLDGAYLSNARMEGARLNGIRLEGAFLGGARMDGADLSGARMDGADLRRAHLDQSTVLNFGSTAGAALSDIDLTDVKISTEQISSMFGDGTVILPDTIPRPSHWPDTELDWGDFEDEWHLWQSDPAAYVPPQHRD
ncbi:pentapeptide repeat-containing protein [Maritimibacter fusiformis]|nr:pentapeptide repeat-containing protein [Maritimibacter fusiformis]